MDPGGKMRADILRRDAERHFSDPLRNHGWTTAIERESPSGEFLVLPAERGEYRHSIALLYSSATSNATYKALAGQVEYIFFNGEPYQLASFAYGLDKPVDPVSEFHTLLLKWNAESTVGKFSPVDDSRAHLDAERPKDRVLLSEQPIEAIWLRLRQFQSVTIASKLVSARADQEGVALDADTIRLKAEGIAYALRNAADYFNAGDARNVSQRVLNFYYGSLAFASAEMLALPNGPKALAEIEKSTTQGHGLYTIDGANDGLEHLVVGAITSGFFPDWLKAIGVEGACFPAKKPRSFHDLQGLPAASWLTIEQLFSSIPEVSDLFFDIFDSAPRWVTPVYDQMTNRNSAVFGRSERTTSSYVLFIDDSARLTKEDIASFPGPIGEITALPSLQSGRQFRVVVDHKGFDFWQEALKLHHSPFERSALILPVFGVVDNYRAISVVLLYALSIIVRYRPSIWRRVQEGDLDHMRVLIEAFLAVAERVLPDQFLQRISGQRVSTHQPGSFFS
jgi:hypothetical protein